jgi:hypothetical protein
MIERGHREQKAPDSFAGDYPEQLIPSKFNLGSPRIVLFEDESMRPVRALGLAAPLALLLAAVTLPAAPSPTYVKKATHVEMVVGSLKASGLPALDGT